MLSIHRILLIGWKYGLNVWWAFILAGENMYPKVIQTIDKNNDMFVCVRRSLE